MAINPVTGEVDISAAEIRAIWPVVLPIIFAIVFGAAAIGFYLPSVVRSAAIDTAFRANLEVADQIKITRGYYTQNVVAKALKNGTLHPSYQHANDPNAIPLPATFVKDISDLLKERDTTLSLISPYPWPHRADRKMDEFQTMAWELFQKDPDASFSRQEVRNGQRVLRVAIADRLTGVACVVCHNSDELSAKKDWKLNDVRAVMEVTKVIEPYLARADSRSWLVVAGIGGATLLVVILLLILTRLIVKRTRENSEIFAAGLVRQNRTLQEHQKELQERNRRFDAALSNMAQGLCIFDKDLRLVACNQNYRKIFDLPEHIACQGTSLRDIITYNVAAGRHPGQTVDKLMEKRLEIVAKGSGAIIRAQINGTNVIEIDYRPMAGGGWVVTYEDITDRERAESIVAEQNRRFDAALNNMPHGLCMFDANKKFLVCNRRFAEMYRLPAKLTQPGISLDEVVEYRVATGQGPLDLKGFRRDQHRRVSEGKPSSYKLCLCDGRTIQIDYEPMVGGGWVTTHQDITESTRAEARINHLARHDALTNLPNRVVFRDNLNEAIKRVSREESVSVLCLDLDQFKEVNDTLGHPVGDKLLQEVAERLLGCVRDCDTAARLGGDEFAIILIAGTHSDGATVLAKRVIETLSAPYTVGGHSIVIGVSIGIAVALQDGATPDELLKNADLALYRAKSEGRGRYSFFELAMDEKIQSKRALELDLRKALENNELDLFYQPLLNIASGQIVGWEALLRWHHPQRGLVNPGEFIALAEEIGLIVPMGAWVLKQACTQAVTWPNDIKVSINLSPVQFKADTLVLHVMSALAASGLHPSRLELEITEAVMLHDTATTLTTLMRLRELGASIAMDDFGTGYSSLSYLRKFPFDKIKIDQSFVRGLPREEESAAIVRSVTGLGRSLGMLTTAEGVENVDQLEMLRAERCDEVQGYLFSAPVPASEIPSLFEKLNKGIRAA